MSGLLVSLVVPLEAAAKDGLQVAGAVRKGIVHWADRNDREALALLHDDDPGRGGRGLTIAALSAARGTRLVRVTSLDRRWHAIVARALSERWNRGIPAPAPPGRWRAYATPIELLADTGSSLEADSVSVFLLSPTTFRVGDRRTGRLDAPLPEPTRLAGGWWDRFAAHTDAGARASVLRGLDKATFVHWVERSVSVTGRFSLLGSEHAFGEARIAAARGFLELAAHGPECDERRAFRALARFARFSGTGRKTMFGFGHTWTFVNGPAPRDEADAVRLLLAAHDYRGLPDLS